MYHPVEHIDDILRLDAPDDAAVAVLGCHHRLSLVALADEFHYLLVYRREFCGAAAVAHVVCVVIQREHRSDELRVRRAVDLEPLPAVARRLVDALGALEVSLPVPLHAHLLLDESDGVLHVLRGVLLHVLLPVAHRRDELEGRYAVLPLKALGDDAVAHKCAVAGGVYLHGAFAEDEEIIVDGDAGLRLRHGAHVAGDAELLCDVEIVGSGILIQEVCREHCGYFAQNCLQSGEAHHERGHGVLVAQDASVGKLNVVSGAAVAADAVVDSHGDVLDDEVHSGMDDAQRLIAKPHSELIEHVRHGEVVCKPPVAEHGLHVARLCDDPGEDGEDIQPSAVIIKRVPEPAPLAAAADLAAVKQHAELFFTDALSVVYNNSHYFTPP